MDNYIGFDIDNQKIVSCIIEKGKSGTLQEDQHRQQIHAIIPKATEYSRLPSILDI